MTTSLRDLYLEITDRDSFLVFLNALRMDLESTPGSWENRTLPMFLDAMESWISDMDGYYKNLGRDTPNPPTWQMFGDILMAAKIYE